MVQHIITSLLHSRRKQQRPYSFTPTLREAATASTLFHSYSTLREATACLREATSCLHSFTPSQPDSQATSTCSGVGSSSSSGKPKTDLYIFTYSLADLYQLKSSFIPRCCKVCHLSL